MWLKSKNDGFIVDEKSAIIGQLYGGALRLYSNTQGLEENGIHSSDLVEFNELFVSRLEGLEKKVDHELKNNHFNL